ncbi:MAG: tail fiber domain-containing protein, partial [Bacteroidota bacterium]
LNKVSQLRGVQFEWSSSPEYGVQMGVIAQEVLQVVPELVFENDGYLGVNNSEMVALFIEAIKELKLQNETLANRIFQLESNATK